MTMMPTILQANVDDLKKVLTEWMNEQLAPKQKTFERPLTREEAAKYLRITPITLDRRFRDGKLPLSLRHVNAGSTYFFASELELHLKRS